MNCPTLLSYALTCAPHVLGEKNQIYQAVPIYVAIIRAMTGDPMGSITMQARASAPTT